MQRDSAEQHKNHISNLMSNDIEELEHRKNPSILEGDSLSFVPINDVGFRCGLIITNTETPKILYTVEFSKDTEEWIPIEGESIKKRYWGVSL